MGLRHLPSYEDRMCLRKVVKPPEAERRSAMSAFDATTERQSPPGERLLGLTAAVSAWIVGAWRTAQNRRSVAKLLEWDERMLRDIGLTGGDVRSVMALPSAQD